VSNWQGGVRVNAVVGGGFLPASRRGGVETGLVAVEDWYATFCGLAGADPADARAAAAGLPPIDSLDVWPLLSGAASVSPREEVVLGAAYPWPGLDSGATVVQGLVRADGAKLLLGDMQMSVMTGPLYPNGSVWQNVPFKCGGFPAADPGSPGGPGCLFNVTADPGETTDLAPANPALAAAMRARIAELQQGVFSPGRGGVTDDSCRAARTTWRGFIGPFLG
jgi:arylsulfatase B